MRLPGPLPNTTRSLRAAAVASIAPFCIAKNASASGGSVGLGGATHQGADEVEPAPHAHVRGLNDARLAGERSVQDGPRGAHHASDRQLVPVLDARPYTIASAGMQRGAGNAGRRPFKRDLANPFETILRLWALDYVLDHLRDVDRAPVRLFTAVSQR